VSIKNYYLKRFPVGVNCKKPAGLLWGTVTNRYKES